MTKPAGEPFTRRRDGSKGKDDEYPVQSFPMCLSACLFDEPIALLFSWIDTVFLHICSHSLLFIYEIEPETWRVDDFAPSTPPFCLHYYFLQLIQPSAPDFSVLCNHRDVGTTSKWFGGAESEQYCPDLRRTQIEICSISKPQWGTCACCLPLKEALCINPSGNNTCLLAHPEPVRQVMQTRRKRQQRSQTVVHAVSKQDTHR